MLSLEPFAEGQGRSAVHPSRGSHQSASLRLTGFTHPLTRTHVRLLGPCFKTGRMGSPLADAGSTQLPRHAVRRVLPTTIAGTTSPQASEEAQAWVASTIRVGPRTEPSGGPALAVPHPTGAHRRPPSASLP